MMPQLSPNHSSARRYGVGSYSPPRAANQNSVFYANREAARSLIKDAAKKGTIWAGQNVRPYMIGPQAGLIAGQIYLDHLLQAVSRYYRWTDVNKGHRMGQETVHCAGQGGLPYWHYSGAGCGGTQIYLHPNGPLYGPHYVHSINVGLTHTQYQYMSHKMVGINQYGYQSQIVGHYVYLIANSQIPFSIGPRPAVQYAIPGFIEAPKPMIVPRNLPDLDTWPMTRITPRLRPRTRPGREPAIETVISVPNGRPASASAAKPVGRKPPTNNQKERDKSTIRLPAAIGVMRDAVNGFTEAMDLVNALHDALPAKYQSPSSNPYHKALALLRNFGKIDMNKAVYNVAADQLEDMVFGAIGQLAKAAARKSPTQTVGYQTGPLH